MFFSEHRRRPVCGPDGERVPCSDHRDGAHGAGERPAPELTVREIVQLKSHLTFGDIMGGGVGVDLSVEDAMGVVSRVYLYLGYGT